MSPHRRGDENRSEPGHRQKPSARWVAAGSSVEAMTGCSVQGCQRRCRIVKHVLRRLLEDECLDRAAGLGFYALLSAAPAILAMVSLLGVVGEAESTTEAVLSLAHDVSAEAASAIQPFIVELTESSSAGATLIGSLALAV